MRLPTAETFHNFVEWFIPPTKIVGTAERKQARLFILSHLLGPFLGNSTALVLTLAEPEASYEVRVVLVAISGFWLFPFLLRWFGRLDLLALVSIQNLTFCTLWVTFFYGGAASPFLSWTLTIPLLAFFYVGDSRTMRVAIVVLLTANALAFYCISQIFEAPPQRISFEAVQALGLLSTVAIGLYVTMMALYYARAIASQAELETVMRHHMATASALRVAAREAEHASAAKVEFLAKMSHELRTPLNAIIGYSQMLLEESEAIDDPETEQDLGRIQASGQHLLKLVNGILDLARIDAGRMELFEEPFRLDAVIADVVSGASAAAAERGNAIEIAIEAGIGPFLGDELKIRGALGQVVENAVKYTQNGRIAVRAARRDAGGVEGIAIAVEDTGIGIAEAFVGTLFEQFAVGDEQTSTKYGGTGLGLALAQKLCRLMGGHIAVETELGRGSCFTLWLPARPAGGAREAPRQPAPEPLRAAA